MNDLIIRAATIDDIPAMSMLWHEKMIIQQQSDRRFRLSSDSRLAWSRTVSGWLDEPCYTIPVAERNAEIVGYLVARVDSAPPGLTPAQVGVVLELAVGAHSYQSGLGRHLLESARHWFVKQEITHLVAYVPRRQPVEQAFWRALGATELTQILWMEI